MMEYSDEKKVVVTGESPTGSMQVASDSESAGWDQKAVRKLLWKLDWNIIPFMSLIYL